MAKKVYLGPCQLSIIALFCENSSLLLTFNYFKQKSFLTDVEQGAKFASENIYDEKQSFAGVLLKKMFLKILQKFTGKHLCWNLFLKTLQA